MTSPFTRGSSNVPFSTVTTISPDIRLPSLAAASANGPDAVEI